jgi:hypothetical protein
MILGTALGDKLRRFQTEELLEFTISFSSFEQGSVLCIQFIFPVILYADFENKIDFKDSYE